MSKWWKYRDRRGEKSQQHIPIVMSQVAEPERDGLSPALAGLAETSPG